jgi:hypothetical protein
LKTIISASIPMMIFAEDRDGGVFRLGRKTIRSVRSIIRDSRFAECRSTPAYYAPAVYPAYYYGGPARYSNVRGFVNGSQGIIRVPPPIYPVQPVAVDRGHSFRWR